MRFFTICLFMPLVLAACATTKDLPTQALREIKPACSAGDMAVCADIGHTIRTERAESAYLAKPE